MYVSSSGKYKNVDIQKKVSLLELYRIVIATVIIIIVFLLDIFRIRQIIVLLVLHSPVLEPDFDLSLW